MKYPISSITNFAYIIVGFYAGGFVGAALMFMGMGSFLYHASDLRPTQTGRHRLRWTQILDWIGMWLVFWSLIWGQIAPPPEAGLFSVALTGYMAAQPSKFHPYGSVPLLFLVLTGLIWLEGGSMLYLVPFALSGAIWKFGRYIVGARWHEDLLHGIWHVGTAIGFYLLV